MTEDLLISAQQKIKEWWKPSYYNFWYTKSFLSFYELFDQEVIENMLKHFPEEASNNIASKYSKENNDFGSYFYNCLWLWEIDPIKWYKIIHYLVSLLIAETTLFIEWEKRIVDLLTQFISRNELHKTEWRNNMILHTFWKARHIETYLHIFEDSIDFITEQDLSNHRLEWKHNDKSFISISLHQIWKKSSGGVLDVSFRHFSDLSDKEKTLIKEIRKAESENWLKVTAKIKHSNFYSIISEKLASKDELTNIHKIWEKYPFAEVQTDIEWGKNVWAKIKFKTKFDNNQNLNI